MPKSKRLNTTRRIQQEWQDRMGMTLPETIRAWDIVKACIWTDLVHEKQVALRYIGKMRVRRSIANRITVFFSMSAATRRWVSRCEF